MGPNETPKKSTVNEIPQQYAVIAIWEKVKTHENQEKNGKLLSLW